MHKGVKLSSGSTVYKTADRVKYILHGVLSP